MDSSNPIEISGKFLSFELLPRLKIAYSELPPIAARWKRAQRAMTIIAEMDEKITTCRTKEPELITESDYLINHFFKDIGDMDIQLLVHIEWFSWIARQTPVYMYIVYRHACAGVCVYLWMHLVSWGRKN
jgi:hypothetical protein